ncbi:efflux RND transporter periplasmic adaptor subunit [Labilibaculum sp. A4]|uniref:efflux RND transporter periplasmic adaptor subunit n=1 Tax=Labilibaculum euxinus TaxID=2686357 RepID=UPI000F61F64F|nr:efflux RND transporter periplasmic adaptor subunit [Labilibaculum euxinus]MDQ1769351.1 efflux RND transporter periplasmic adaptor subunit [Labilibaculum euxinus]MWN74877.1 efflux RND transporter periplasmic adaptor subunit [Labilibaculum euxinus]
MKTKIFIAFIAIASLMSCNSSNNKGHEGEEHEEHGAEGVVILKKNQRDALNLKLGSFLMRNLTTVVKTNGQLEVPPSSSADVTAIIGGNVKSIKVFHGDKVSKGQLLAILEHPDYIILQEEFSEVANKLEYLEKEYERQKELFENNVGAGKDYQQVKSEYNTAKAKYAGLKSRLQLINLSPDKIEEGIISNTVNILSPINGFVNDINIRVGSYVDAKDILFEITDNSAIHADFMIYEKDVHLVKEGQKVHFTVSNRPDEELTATVFAIGKEFEAKSRAVHIHADINEKVSGLISGMYISGHLHTDEKYTRTLPNDAIVTEGTKSFIFVLDKESMEEHDAHDEGNKSHEEVANHDNDNDEGHNHDEHANELNDENREMTFRMVEVITGLKDEGYTEIKLIDSLPENTQIVMNAAYYLLSDMGKEETEHNH